MMFRRLFGRLRQGRQDQSNAFPTQQLFILALCRICEPIAFMSIFPYIYFMISSFNITDDESRIAVYAGMVTSAFAFAEFSTGVLWGRLSDVVGRKPVLLCGLAGTGVSMIIFGFAPSLPVALFARALGGLLNGNIGVIQTTVAEVVKTKEHQPRAYAIMPFVWCLGSIIGAGLGGSLAEPVKNYPSVFAKGTILETFPFLLPNLICAFVVIFSLVIGILFLDETHSQKRHRRDPGRELGHWLVAKVHLCVSAQRRYSKCEEAQYHEHQALLAGSPPPDYASAESSPRLHATRCDSVAAVKSTESAFGRELPLDHAPQSFGNGFSRQVVLHIIAYGTLAFHTISFEQLLPVLLSSPESNEPPTLPFKFIGGYGLHSNEVGLAMSLQGVYQMIAQLVIFPYIANRLGMLRTFRLTAMAWGFLYIAAPYLVLLPHALRMPGLAIVLIVKVTLQSLAYPTNALLLANSAPSLLCLGSINGVAASAASLCRAFGPTLSGFIQSAGAGIGYSGLAWWVSAAVAALGAVECYFMIEPSGRTDLYESRRVPDIHEEGPAPRTSYDSNISDRTLVQETPDRSHDTKL